MNEPQIFKAVIWNPISISGSSTAKIEFFPKGALVVEGGKIVFCGEEQTAIKKFPAANILDFSNQLLIPGFIDTHTHMPQLDIIGSHSNTLLHWLDTYTFPKESQFSDEKISRDTSQRFLRQLLENGVTFAAMFSTTHEQTTNILFEEASKIGNKAIIGKVSMDRNAPKQLLQEVTSDHQSSETLIKKWHGHDDRLFYALTPRFAPTSTPELLESIGDLKKNNPDLWIQTHFSESADEIEFVKKLFPDSKDYLSVYEKYGLLGDKTILAHCIHPNKSELERVIRSKTSVSHCPTSNMFLGSGMMPVKDYLNAGVRLSLGSDVGGGTSLSPWQTMNESYKIQSHLDKLVSPSVLFYLATLGGAASLGIEKTTGNFKIGKDADFQILEPNKLSSLSKRFEEDRSPENLILPMMMSADSRIMNKVYVRGKSLTF